MKQVFSFILILFLSSFAISAQTSSMKKIKQQQQATQKAIKETSKKIQANTAETKKSLNQLNLIEAEMAEQEKTIDAISKDLVNIDVQLKAINDSILGNEAKLSKLRQNYAKALKKMSVHSSAVDRLLFIFSSSSFHQAYRRIRYLKQFSKWREKQTVQIQAVQGELLSQHNQIKQYHNVKTKSLNMQNQARLTLAKKQEEQKLAVASLKAQSKELQSVLAEKKRQATNLDQQLDRMIAEEERKAAERARIKREQEERRRLAAEEQKRKQEEARREREAQEAAKREQQAQKEASKRDEQAKKDATKKDQQAKKDAARREEQARKEAAKREEARREQAKKEASKSLNASSSKSSGGYQMSDQERSLSGSFESNKGRLLFPVSGSYRIVKTFGRQRHPELRYVETDNGGIDIETKPGASARAVFNGVVSGIFRQDGFNTVVMVRHGNYLTIYVNLSEIYVSSGETVKANQAIGKIFSDPDDNNRTILHFEVRRERTKLNPQEWVR